MDDKLVPKYPSNTLFIHAIHMLVPPLAPVEFKPCKLNIKNPHVKGLFIPRLMLRFPPILA